MSPPRVSVCIPTRDRAAWLGEAIASALGQTFGDLEVLVHDDASTDGTAELLAGIRDPRLRTLRHRRALGVARNRNSLLAAARGELVAWLDSDDRWLPHMLEVQVAVMDRHPAIAFAHGAFEVIAPDGSGLPDWPAAQDGDAVEPGLAAFRELVLRDFVGAPTVLVRRTAHEAAGPYRTSLASGEDWDMWLRLALQGDVAYTAQPLAQYRWHPGSLTRSAARSGAGLRRDLAVIRGVFARHRARIPDAAREHRRAHAALASRAVAAGTEGLTRGRRLSAVGAVLFALRAHPGLAGRRASWRLAAAAAAGAEYPWHLAARETFGRLADELAGSRMAEGLRRAAEPPREWERTLRAIAAAVREVVPPEAALAAVDKWDPTLLHLSGRRGWHFPDRRLIPDGYPREGAAVVRHLEELRRRGARYLLLPRSGWWWLDCYPELGRHLESTGRRVWSDERCLIYRLEEGRT